MPAGHRGKKRHRACGLHQATEGARKGVERSCCYGGKNTPAACAHDEPRHDIRHGPVSPFPRRRIGSVECVGHHDHRGAYGQRVCDPDPGATSVFAGSPA